jgi:hypothetical protein
LIRRARYFLAAAGTTAILAGGMTLAGAGAASAATLPSCAGGVNCSSNSTGSAGYLGADDNHTHYRYVQTETVATPQLVHLNGLSNEGSTGVSLCDENSPVGSGTVAQLSLGLDNAGVYQVAWVVGQFPFTLNADPCVQNAGPFINPFTHGHLLQFTGISKGDSIFLSIAYNQGTSPSIKFSACDATSKVCRSATTPVSPKSFTEFGIGAFTFNHGLTSPPNNPLAPFLLNQVACYSCAAIVPITSVSPVNPFNIGGLFETQLVNISSNPIMSPNDSLAVSTDTFGVQNGSFIG